jgi:hypothetical protein
MHFPGKDEIGRAERIKDEPMQKTARGGTRQYRILVGKKKSETGASAGFAFYANSSAMGFDDVLDDGKA